MCLATVSPTNGRNDSVAYPGIPPVRSGHIVASSARHRHKKQPAIVIVPMRMMPSAPVPCTTNGAIPVTRMVPARPITKAPHQFVPLTRPFSGSVPSTVVIAYPFVSSGDAAGRRPAFLIEGQVALGLPVGHHGVPGMELLALHLREVVGVVAVWRLAERVAQHLVADEFVRRVEQRRRQRPDAPAG